MSESTAQVLMLAWLAGGGLGGAFFGGLWWTVRKGIASRRPMLWLFGSLLIRMSVALAGFYFVGSGRWERLVACLVGFLMARHIVAWLARVYEQHPANSGQEAGHAP